MDRFHEKVYWKAIDERSGLAEAGPEFDDTGAEAPRAPSRRDFLKAAGFTVAGSLLAGCSRTPLQEAIPYLVKPEEITPGRAYYYASTCAACGAGCGLLVKNRDGRPIKLEGNPEHSLTAGALCAVGQASILGLYDSRRPRGPLAAGRSVTWKDFDAEILTGLARIRGEGGAVRYVSHTVISPTRRNWIDRFLKTFKDGRHIVYDALSSSAILDAHERTHGVRVLPRFHFERATVIVSVDADFLGTWISPVEFTLAYSAGRKSDSESGRFSHHVHLESRLSLTGGKADRRVRIAPLEAPLLLSSLAWRLARRAGTTLEGAAPQAGPERENVVTDLEGLLWGNRGNALLVCGSQDVETQTLVNFINHTIGAYGQTLDVERPSYQRQGNDRELTAFLAELEAGKVSAVILDGVNPVYELPGGDALARRLTSVPLTVSFAERLDETTLAARFVGPTPHALEEWGDAEPVAGTVSLFQPAIAPMGITRPVLETLAAWTGAPATSYDLLRDAWKSTIHPRYSARLLTFEAFWDQAVHDGFASVDAGPVPDPRSAKPFDLRKVNLVRGQAAEADLTLVLYPKVGMLDGRHAYNPWLQELPDPISKVTWDNYACVSPDTAARFGIRDGDVLRIRSTASTGVSLELPALVQPGLGDRIVAVALGYGGLQTERFNGVGPAWLHRRETTGTDGRVGKNAAIFLALKDGSLRFDETTVSLERTGVRQELASTQSHHSLTVPEHLRLSTGGMRPIVQETTLGELQKDPHAGAEGHEATGTDLWPEDHPLPGSRWAMVIDLSACTGCSACVVACQVENNVPVVGKDEVRRKREMHWIRIDRYYSGDGDDVDVAHQPMMCQHCGNAPCETVCPVLATVHSEDGLNQQVYNRCVGTRYCANNCPYKVRRFNWFDYPREDLLANLSLNPDVTVRSRGVMEKCSFCIQRIHDARAEAAREGRPLRDGEIETACQQSCPARAIEFGDLNDPGSRVRLLAEDGRYYRVLEETNVRPAIGYLRLVRNRPAKQEQQHG